MSIALWLLWHWALLGSDDDQFSLVVVSIMVVSSCSG